MDRSRLKFARALIACGFVRDGRDVDPLIYKLTVGDRELDLQLWKDGRHRVSHMVRRVMPASGLLGGCMSTYPSEFRTVAQMHRAILIELSRTDHAPGAYGYVQGWGAATDIVAERQRQIEVEGWTAEHDDHHVHGELADAAACYAVGELVSSLRGKTVFTRIWPWPDHWWKPKDRRRDLVRAGALIVAEIERLDRAAVRS